MPPRRSARKAQATVASGDPTNGNVDTSTVADDTVDVTVVKKASTTRKSTRSLKKATVVDSVQDPSIVSTTPTPADVNADLSKPGKKRAHSDDSDEKDDKPTSKKSKKSAKTVDDKTIDQKKDASKMVRGYRSMFSSSDCLLSGWLGHVGYGVEKRCCAS